MVIEVGLHLRDEFLAAFAHTMVDNFVFVTLEDLDSMEAAQTLRNRRGKQCLDLREALLYFRVEDNGDRYTFFPRRVNCLICQVLDAVAA